MQSCDPHQLHTQPPSMPRWQCITFRAKPDLAQPQLVLRTPQDEQAARRVCSDQQPARGVHREYRQLVRRLRRRLQDPALQNEPANARSGGTPVDSENSPTGICPLKSGIHSAVWAVVERHYCRSRAQCPRCFAMQAAQCPQDLTAERRAGYQLLRMAQMLACPARNRSGRCRPLRCCTGRARRPSPPGCSTQQTASAQVL